MSTPYCLLSNPPYYRPTQVRPFTNHLANLLSVIYRDPPRPVKTEWRAMLREEVRSVRGSERRVMYGPVIDLAVGPFATGQRYVSEYDRMAEQSVAMLASLLRLYRHNLRRFGSNLPAPTLRQLCTLNRNSRCFLAVEVEKGNANMKYLTGSTVHAAALGRVGVLVAWDEGRARDLLSVREYFAALKSYGKNITDPDNLLVVTRCQIKRTLERIVRDTDGRPAPDDFIVAASGLTSRGGIS
jgi:hypothetical protein